MRASLKPTHYGQTTEYWPLVLLDWLPFSCCDCSLYVKTEQKDSMEVEGIRVIIKKVIGHRTLPTTSALLVEFDRTFSAQFHCLLCFDLLPYQSDLTLSTYICMLHETTMSRVYNVVRLRESFHPSTMAL